MWKIVIRGILIGISTLASFSIAMRLGASLEGARTSALITLVMSQLIHVFECKSETKSLFGIKIFSNLKLIFAVLISALVLAAAVVIPQLQPIFQTVMLTPDQLFAALGMSVAVPFLSSVFSLIPQDRN